MSPSVLPVFRASLLGALAVTVLARTPASASPAHYVELLGRATLPTDTRAEGPDAGAAVGEAFAQAELAVDRQPVQGFSAVLPAGAGTYLVLMDNGFGSQQNSADVLLRWYHVRPNFETSDVEILGHTELKDPRHNIPFPIVRGDGDRVLTGADFDPESFQPALDGTYWVGEEFGPFLLHVDAQGVVLDQPVAAPVPAPWAPHARDSDTFRSPQHPDLRDLTAEAALERANLRASKGFEGLALLPHGDRLLAMLEGSLMEHPDGGLLPLLEFDLKAGAFTGRFWQYPLESRGHAIGAVQAIAHDELLVLERDDRQGDDALHKAVHRIRLDSANSGSVVSKELAVDLLNIPDSRGMLTAPVYLPYRLPFVTLESLLIVDERTLLVINDNNFPFFGRHGNRPDETVFTLLRLSDPLALQRPANWPASLAAPAPADVAVDELTPLADRERHPVQLARLHRPNIYAAGDNGIAIDLGDTSLSGRVFTAAFYGETTPGQEDRPSQWTAWRGAGRVTAGRGILPINRAIDTVGPMARGTQGVLAYRLDLWQARSDGPRSVGFVDSRVHYRRTDGGFRPMLSIVEGPMVGEIHSDRPDLAVVAFETDRPALGRVEVQGQSPSESYGGPDHRALRHEIPIAPLKPGRSYRYRAVAIAEGDTARTPWFRFTTAPLPGQGSVRFAFAGDSRRSYGGGEAEYLGVNRRVLSQVIQGALDHDVDFLLFGGDLITGHVTSEDDFVTELKAFKQVLFPLTVSRPFYTAIGNHESLVRGFLNSQEQRVFLDRWPYRSSSAEALFARELLHPTNGPADPEGLPPYRENVFTFRFGPLQILVCNNNYWYTGAWHVAQVGGAPQGYMFDDQLTWIEERLAQAEADPTVRVVFLTMQEPVFPNGGHLDDAMWYEGDNRVRAHSSQDSGMAPQEQGIIEVRNRFWKAVSASSKVAAVLCSDEHNYHRTLIGPETPTGIPDQDDSDGNGVLDDGLISANADFKHPTWSIVSGGAGAPYYIGEDAPWNEAMARFTTAHHYLILEVDSQRAGLQVRSIDGELLDEVEDLLAVKRAP